VLEERDGRGLQGGRQREAGTPSSYLGNQHLDNQLLDHNQLWRNLPARAASVRHLTLAADPADNDVVDPYRRSADYYHRMEDELAPAIVTILRYARLNAAAGESAARGLGS
jgi:hypothetical protein